MATVEYFAEGFALLILFCVTIILINNAWFVVPCKWQWKPSKIERDSSTYRRSIRWGYWMIDY